MNAAERVTKFENVRPGDPWAEEAGAADAAIASEWLTAWLKLSPLELGPTSADAIAEYEWRTGRLGSVGYGDQLAALHELCVTSHPELARLLRSRDALDDVGEAAARHAAPAHHLETHAAAASRAAAAARARYQLAIASQIAAVPGHDLAKHAKALVACDELRKRLAAERARREAHAVAELERSEAAQRDADAAVAAERARRVREAADVAARAEIEAQRARTEARLVRAEALREAFKERLTRARRPDRLMLRHAGQYHNVEAVVGNAIAFSDDQLTWFESALRGGAFTEDGAAPDPWRFA